MNDSLLIRLCAENSYVRVLTIDMLDYVLLYAVFGNEYYWRRLPQKTKVKTPRVISFSINRDAATLTTESEIFRMKKAKNETKRLLGIVDRQIQF